MYSNIHVFFSFQHIDAQHTTLLKLKLLSNRPTTWYLQNAKVAIFLERVVWSETLVIPCSTHAGLDLDGVEQLECYAGSIIIPCVQQTQRH